MRNSGFAIVLVKNFGVALLMIKLFLFNVLVTQ